VWELLELELERRRRRKLKQRDQLERRDERCR
jgi:hypothetical protein